MGDVSSEESITRSSATTNSYIEIAHEAIDDERTISDDNKKSESINSVSFIETQKAELTKAFFKGLGISKQQQ